MSASIYSTPCESQSAMATGSFREPMIKMLYLPAAFVWMWHSFPMTSPQAAEKWRKGDIQTCASEFNQSK